MNMDQIRYFLTAARCMNFTNAAAELNTTQATLSRQISSLERELNLLLFLRDTRNIKLTPSGQYLYREFSAIYSNYQTVLSNAQKIFAGYDGQMTIGVLNEIHLQDIILDTIGLYQHNHANRELSLKRCSFKQITDGLLDLSIDLAITLFVDISNIPSLEYRLLDNPRDGIIISKRNVNSSKEKFRPIDFKNETFILLSDSEAPNTSQHILDLCRKSGFYPKVRFSPDLDTAMLWTEAGLGLAITNEHAISVLSPSMTFIPFEEGTELPGAKIVLVWNPDNMNPAKDAFLKILEKRMAGGPGGYSGQKPRNSIAQ